MDGALKGGIWLSLALFVILFILSITKTCDWFGCELRATAFWNSPPNEIGDTLAGIAGALAFLWIIVTVMLQSKELAAQRAELQLTRMEFKRMADAQGQQLTLLLEARSGEQFEASLDAVRSFEFELHYRWYFQRFDKPVDPPDFETFNGFSGKDVPEIAKIFSYLVSRLKQQLEEGQLIEAPSEISDEFVSFKQVVDNCVTLEPDLSPAKKAKFEASQISVLSKAVAELIGFIEENHGSSAK